MMTPQEIRDTQFNKAMFGGYDMGEVDEFLAELGADYSALYKENAVLKNKLKLLAETVEEYRSVDEAMRKALVTAQNMANGMVADAQKKANELIANASGVAQARVSDLANKIAEEEKRLADAKRATGDFASQILGMYKNQAEMIHGIMQMTEVPEEAPSMDDTVSLATEQISQSVEEALKKLQSYQSEQAEEPAAEADSFVHDIERKIEEKPVEELGDTAPIPTAVQSYKVNDQGEAEIVAEDGQISFAAVENGGEAEDASTQKFNLSELKFGKNYDFSEE